jgi:hypothetical protein
VNELATSLVVRTQEQWLAVLASGKGTPLDALTPYGRRRFLGSLQWGNNGLGGFRVTPLVRELSLGQLSEVLSFLGSVSYLPMLRADLGGPPLRLPEPSANVELRLKQLEEFANTETEKHISALVPATPVGAAPVLRRYLDLFGERMQRGALQRQALGDLPLLFDAATLVDSENPGSSALAHMLLIHRELVARGIDTRRTFDGTVFSAFIAAREFDEARAFAATRPHLARLTIPNVADPLGRTFRGRSAYRYDAARNTLTREAVPYLSGTQLVMVVDAGCHFSREALDAIHNDTNLQARLRKANLLLITPPRSAIPLRLISDWNAANPSMPLRVPYNAHEWQEIQVTGVPAFYLLKNGHVKDELRTGWPAGGNKAALLKLLDTASTSEGGRASNQD